MNLRNSLLRIVLAISLLIIPANGQRLCRTPVGTRGECVSIYDCAPLLRLLQRSPLTDDIILSLRRSQCSRRPNEKEFVCCEQTANSINHPTQFSSPSNNVGNIIDECGVEPASTRIIGGSETKLTEYPWLALLEYERRDGSWTAECGGFLINRRYVVTAAHCILGDKVDKVGRLINIRIGEYNVETDPDCIVDEFGDQNCNDPVLNLAVEEITTHENYLRDNPSNNQNDIALVRLSGNVEYSNSRSPICLPTPNFPGTRVGGNVTVAGWGQTLESQRNSVKLKVTVPIVSAERCEREYSRKTELSFDLQMCAGGNFIQDSCFRDSGGPLISRENGLWIAEGIVSFGTGCGIEVSSVYTRVSAFVPWILDNMRP
ncbi:CLIP domain-containing serine protease B9-like [Phlebotomus argentipes]|uniref:CLIP domain-containing serine protease B9-like n=1 Tax=Phlebotomus argentipes TaxID=94469 RepID=UPI0028932D15|nr:CLIP domain-containing serine protease B9-like [Phlebotomus argentipes]